MQLQKESLLGTTQSGGIQHQMSVLHCSRLQYQSGLRIKTGHQRNRQLTDAQRTRSHLAAGVLSSSVALLTTLPQAYPASHAQPASSSSINPARLLPTQGSHHRRCLAYAEVPAAAVAARAGGPLSQGAPQKIPRCRPSAAPLAAALSSLTPPLVLSWARVRCRKACM